MNIKIRLPKVVDLNQNDKAKLVYSADRSTAYCLSYDTLIAVVKNPCDPVVYRTQDNLSNTSMRHWRAFCDALNLTPDTSKKYYLDLPKATDANGGEE